ncbi:MULTISPECIES: hypothetical protein [Brevibacillus]|uniref:hypothetical protein n=1 Tax=Brevibacillus TaxID=55080 RepID=UPI001C2459D3|nr:MULTISPECIES: hypothetical protein [Brevibacillus]MBU8715144.1 hypothetical protein [Brevibacillus parabrevis]MDH6352833.1 hypothetical protein [Brevibacillus sp. 1238]MED2255092.1 hypothetical protein [Brevibacillus parabrevis]WDV96191.1 hypothetical protein PSE45_04330 [Brevibacillus parabrevis]
MSFFKKTNSLVLALSLAIVTILSPTAAAYAEERVEVSKVAKKSQQGELTEETVTEEDEIQEAELRAAPLIPIVLIIVRAGVMYIKYKNKLEEAYEKVRESYVKKEVEELYSNKIEDRDREWDGDVKSDTTLKVFKLKGYPDGIHLEFGDPDDYGMTHILARHHPEYWTGDYNGYDRDPLSMFNPSTSMRDIEKIIQSVIDYRENSQWMKERLDQGNYKPKGYVGYHDGNLYKLVVSGGSITTLYPYGWNEVEE